MIKKMLYKNCFYRRAIKMEKNFIHVPLVTSLNEIKERNYTLSATQYKTFSTKNKNLVTVADFLDRSLTRTDLGIEVGSDSYVDYSPKVFIKTKALQKESYIINEVRDATEYIKPQSFIQMNLKKGDILISKDSNVGEIIVLDKDYPNAMICGGIYRLPVTKNKYYLLAFIKNDLFRQQIDFLVPRGSTIRHGKTKFLECKIPMPNFYSVETIRYIELLTRAIVNKEIVIKNKYNDAMNFIESEIVTHQRDSEYIYKLPTLEDLQLLDRVDSSLYSPDFRQKEFFIRNYIHGTSTVKELGFSINRGQNLQISNIGKSIRTKEKRSGYYKLILPNYISKYGTVSKVEYLGNSSNLKTLNKGDIIFGAEGNEKGRSYVIIQSEDNAITNIHGITLNQVNKDLRKSIVVKLFLDYYRLKGMIDAYAVGGNGGSMAIKYWDFLRFPNFPNEVEITLSSFYYNDAKYETKDLKLNNFITYDNRFNKKAGIYEIDLSLKYLQKLLDHAIDKIANDEMVDIIF